MSVSKLKPDCETIDYSVDWSSDIGEATITASTWVFPTGLTQGADDSTDTTTTVIISGGTAGQEYLIENTVTLSDGQILCDMTQIMVSGV